MVPAVVIVVSLNPAGRNLPAAKALCMAVHAVQTVQAIKMQKLIFPQEIEVWYILPAIRKQLAAKLVENGLAQKEVAKLMQITEAAVSQYKKMKRAKENIFDADIEKEIDLSVKEILKDKNSLVNEISRLAQFIKERGTICNLHKKKSSLAKEHLPCLNCVYHKEE